MSSVPLDETTLKKVMMARKEGESPSDVVARLIETKVVALQQRGEKTVTTSDNRRLLMRIDQTKCMGAESCVTVAPNVFSLDVKQLGWGKKGDPLGIKDVPERGVDSETVIIAAQSCPYRAIYVKDVDIGEELVGYP